VDEDAVDARPLLGWRSAAGRGVALLARCLPHVARPNATRGGRRMSAVEIETMARGARAQLRATLVVGPAPTPSIVAKYLPSNGFSNFSRRNAMPGLSLRRRPVATDGYRLQPSAGEEPTPRRRPVPQLISISQATEWHRTSSSRLVSP